MGAEWRWEKHALHEFIPWEWFRDPTDSSGWLRIYSSIGLAHVEFREKIESTFSEIENCPFGVDQPVAMAYGQLKGFEASEISWTFLAEEDGRTRTVIRHRDRKLPLGNYIVFVLPFRVDGHPGDQAAVQAAMNQSAAVLIAHLGRNLLVDLVYEGEVRADGVVRMPELGIVPVPQAVEGPYVEAELWSDFCAAMHRLSQTRSPKRDRIKLALEYLHAAVGQDRAFFEYWVSLEILCNGRAGTIAERIKECNSFKNVQEVKERTGFDVLRRWRQDFFHKGQRPVLSAPVERYLQLLFLDLFRHELDLPYRGRMLEFQDSGRCDLTPLGLKDRRGSKSECGALPGHVVIETG